MAVSRRELVKRLAVGGIVLAGGGAAVGQAALAAPGGNKGRPGPTPTPTPGTDPTPTPTPSGGSPLVVGSPASIELSITGGKRAKARFTLSGTAAGGTHGWRYLDAADPTSGLIGMQFEPLSTDIEGLAFAGDTAVDVKGWLNNGQSEGSYSFVYWHAANGAETRYMVTVSVLDRGKRMESTASVLP